MYSTSCQRVYAGCAADAPEVSDPSFTALLLSVARLHVEIPEVHDAVRLRPQAQTPTHGLLQLIFQVLLAVDGTKHRALLDDEFQLVPLASLRGGGSNLLDHGAPAIPELEQDQVV